MENLAIKSLLICSKTVDYQKPLPGKPDCRQNDEEKEKKL